MAPVAITFNVAPASLPSTMKTLLLPVEPLCGVVDAEPLPDEVRPDVEPLLDVVLLPELVDDPFAGVHGTCVVFVDGVCPLDEPVVDYYPSRLWTDRLSSAT